MKPNRLKRYNLGGRLQDKNIMDIKFINRKQELDYLGNFLQRPSFSAVLVRGAAGLGKTYMLRHFSEMAAEEGHWIHYLPLYALRGSTEFGYLVAEFLSSGQYLVGKDPNSWKELLQSDPEINNLFLSLLEYSRGVDTTRWLRSIVDLISQKFLTDKQLVIVFDEIEATENTERTVAFLESLVRSFSNIDKVKLIFAGRSSSSLRRLERYTRLNVLNLDEFSVSEVKEYLSYALSDSNMRAERIEKLAKDIAEQSRGVPLFISLLLEQAKQTGLEHTLESTRFPESIENIVDITIRSVTNNQEDILNLLKATAILGGSARTDLLMDFLNKNRSELMRLIDQAAQSSFVRFDQNGSMLFVHDVIRDFIIQKYLFPSEFDPILWDFGSEEAETDRLLETNFIYNSVLDEIFLEKKNLILGDRGSGKSSIFRFISEFGKFPIPSDKKKNYQTLFKKLLVVPCDDPTSIIQSNSFFDNPNITPERFKLFWLLYIALLSASTIYKQGDYTNPANWKDLTDILKKAGILDKIDGPDTSLFGPLLDWITKIGSKVSFSIAGIPITFEPSAEIKAEKPKFSVDISKLLELSNLVALNLDQQLIILIDKVDEIFKYEREKQEKFVQGLFLAISYLAKYSNLTLMVFLRTDIFQTYDIQEKNKLISRSLILTWNQKDIFRLLINRIVANEVFEGIRPFIKVDGDESEASFRIPLMIIFPEQVEGLPFIEWISKMMRNGKNHISPREVILFLVILKDILTSSDTSSKQVPVFNDTNVKQAINRLSELSYDQIISDFRIASTFIRNCRAGKISEFTEDEVKSLFSEQEGSMNSQLGLLEKLGILERVVRVDPEKGFTSKYRFPDLYTRCWYY
jgi:hypothetical protein